MDTLSYGFKKPANSDTGDVVFPALESNIQLVNDHTHNGSNSAPLATQSISALHANWVSLGGGQYRQLLTLPTGYLYDTASIWMRNQSTGEQVYLKLLKASATTFYLYTTDAAADYYVLVR